MADSSVETWKVKQYGANVYHLAQQKGSKFQGFCRPEQINGESKYLDILGPTEALDKTTRNGDTPNVSMNHYRRMITMSDKDWGTMIENMDKARMIHDLKSPYLMAAVNAFGRKKDDMFLKAFIANAIEEKDGGVSTAFPNTQKICATTGAAITDLNLNALLTLKRSFDEKDLDPELDRHIVVTPKDLINLLNTTEIKNADYNSVKALAEGKINTFLGFNFHMSNRLLTQAWGKFDLATGLYSGSGTDSAATNRILPAWVGSDAMIYGYGEEPKVEMGKRADKSFNEQLYISMSLGFMRMEDVKCMTVTVKGN